MIDFIKALNEYGADTASALHRCVGDEDLYCECVKLFIEDRNFDGLSTELSRRNYRSAFEHAHALKGVAANLSLTPIFNAISAIVEPLRIDSRTADYDKLLSNLKAEHDKLEQLVARF